MYLFFASHSYYQERSDFYPNPNSIARYSQRLTKSNFTCRIDGPHMSVLAKHCFSIHYWIEEQVSHFHEVILLYNSHYLVCITFTTDRWATIPNISLVSIKISFITC